jgi:parallel beta-helix repeat protein
MTPRKLLAAVALAAAALVPATSHAQAFRAYLSSHGIDNPACSLASPCRLLPAALTAVAPGGEVWMLDSANYNSTQVLVQKSVTILAVPGAVGSVVAANGSAIAVDFAGVKVVLRNLVIVPLPGGGGTNGVYMATGAALTVENCLISNLPGSGIAVQGASSVRVVDSIVRDNTNHGIYVFDGPRATIVRSTVSGNTNMGIAVSGTLAGTTTTADIAESTIDGNLHGVWASSTNATATVSVSLRENRIVGNIFDGAVAESGGAAVTISASNNLLAGNQMGLEAFAAGSRLWASGNMVAGNSGTGLRNSGGLFESAGNNAVRNNGQDTIGVITPVARR